MPRTGGQESKGWAIGLGPGLLTGPGPVAAAGSHSQRWDEASGPSRLLAWGIDGGGGTGSTSGDGWRSQTASPHCLAQGPGCRCWRPSACWRSLPTGWSSLSRLSSSPEWSTGSATARAGRAPTLQSSKGHCHTALGGGVGTQTVQRPLGKLAQPQLSKGARGRLSGANTASAVSCPAGPGPEPGVLTRPQWET